MVFVIFECFRGVECRVVVCRDDGFSFFSVREHISYWRHSLFPDCSGTDSLSISLIRCLPSHGAFFLFCCQSRACGLNDFDVIVHPAAQCSGFLHWRQSRSLMRLWNSSPLMLSRGCLPFASKSIGSRGFWLLLFDSRYVPFGFHGVFSVRDIVGAL